MNNGINNSQYTALGHFLILGKSLSGQGDIRHLSKNIMFNLLHYLQVSMQNIINLTLYRTRFVQTGILFITSHLHDHCFDIVIQSIHLYLPFIV